jgi:hypothetical protein
VAGLIRSGPNRTRDLTDCVAVIINGVPDYGYNVASQPGAVPGRCHG